MVPRGVVFILAAVASTALLGPAPRAPRRSVRPPLSMLVPMPPQRGLSPAARRSFPQRALAMLFSTTEEASGGGGAGAGPNAPAASGTARREGADALRAKAARLARQAEKLKLEAEKEQLQLDQERLAKRRERLLHVEDVVQRLLNCSVFELKPIIEENKPLFDEDLFFRLAELGNMARSSKERDDITQLAENVMRTLEAVDTRQADEVSQAIYKEVTAGAKKDDTSGGPPSGPADSQADMLRGWIESVLQNSSSGANATVSLSDGVQLVNMPQWIPAPLLPLVLDAEAGPMDTADLEQVKKLVFGPETFFVSGEEVSPYIALYRGTLRGESDEVFNKVQERLAAVPGLSDRVQLLLMPDPTPDPVRRVELMERGLPPDALGEPEPVFVAISGRAKPLSAQGAFRLVYFVPLLLSVITTFSYALGVFAFSNDFYDRLVEQGDVTALERVLPVVGGILGLSALHELSHFVAGAARGVKLGIPFALPSLQTGTYGSITKFLSFPKDRKTQFDVAAAGPLMGLVASVGLLAAGLYLGAHATPGEVQDFPVLPASFFRGSALVGALASALDPTSMAAPPTSPVSVHPLAVVGVAGAVINALNLLPVGRLDGGRMATAALGRRTASAVANTVLLLQALSFFVSTSGLQLYWGLIIVLFQRNQDVPATDEVTPLDEGRRVLFYAAMAAAALALLPFPLSPGGGGFGLSNTI